MSILQSILSDLPSILKGIIAVEQVITAPKSGGTRKALILSAVQAAAQAGETVPNSTVAGYSALIDYSVATLNKANVLGPNGTAVAAATAAAS